MKLQHSGRVFSLISFPLSLVKPNRYGHIGLPASPSTDTNNQTHGSSQGRKQLALLQTELDTGDFVTTITLYLNHKATYATTSAHNSSLYT